MRGYFPLETNFKFMTQTVTRQNDLPWHALPEDEVPAKLETGRNGLTNAEAAKRLEKYGRNELEAREGIKPLKLVLKQLRSPLIYLLIAAAIISFFTGHVIDAGVIAGVVALNTLLGTVQEWRAERALEALRRMGAATARVRRTEEDKEIPASDVVPGDLLLLETGERVAADARVLTSGELYTDESALTGESEPVLKSPGQQPESAPVADRANMVWMSSPVTAGRGTAIVVATGMDSVMGRIAAQVQRTEREETPLQRQVGRLGTVLGIAGLLLAVLISVLGILRGYQIFDMLLYAVAVAVSAIPEGLPAVISVTLALGVQRMAKRHAIVRRLPAVETLGSTTVICSDKTGTITQNQMTVTKIWADGQTYPVTGQGYRPQGGILTGNNEKITGNRLPHGLRTLMLSGILANNSRLRQTGNSWEVEGNPTEGAILAAAFKAGIVPADIQASHSRKGEIPFSSEQKYMAVLSSLPEKNRAVIYLKGAPERVFCFCDYILENGRRVELDDHRRKALLSINQEFASEGLRVVAAACKEISPDRKQIDRSLTVEGGAPHPNS